MQSNLGLDFDKFQDINKYRMYIETTQNSLYDVANLPPCFYMEFIVVDTQMKT